MHPLKQHPLWALQQGRCWICGGPMTKRKKGPSRDHLIPKSRGGKGLAENILLAHRICNSSRGNKLISELFPEIAIENLKQAVLQRLSLVELQP